MTLLVLFHALYSFWTFLHVIVTIINILENMANIVVAIDSNRWSAPGNLRVGVVEPCFLGFSKFTFSFMFHQSRDISEVVTTLVLTRIHRLAFAVAASSDMEAPFTIFHQLMVLVERANENPCLGFRHF